MIPVLAAGGTLPHAGERADAEVFADLDAGGFVPDPRPNARPILALDIGTSLGWALRTRAGVSSGTKSFAEKRNETRGDRLLRLWRWLSGMNREPLAYVAYELVRAHGPGGILTAHCYGQFEGVLLTWAARNGIEVRPVGVGTVRKAVCGNGNAKKPDVDAAVRALGFVPSTHDEADAIAVLLWATGDQ